MNNLLSPRLLNKSPPPHPPSNKDVLIEKGTIYNYELAHTRKTCLTHPRETRWGTQFKPS